LHFAPLERLGMTQAGTGIAAGVAQTALQAQQVARRRDAAVSREAADAKRLRELLQTHMQALEEGDEFESPAQLHIDGQMPEGEHPRDSVITEQRRQEDEEDSAGATPPPQTNEKGNLYRHLDLQA
jgi:hypothetical protein